MPTLTFPRAYQWLRAHGLHGLTPWQFIEDGPTTARLSKEFHVETGRMAVAFAHRQDRDDAAFFAVEDDALQGRVLSAHLSWVGRRDNAVASNVREHETVWAWLCTEAIVDSQEWISEEEVAEIQGPDSPLSEAFIQDYERVAGRGAILELKMRMLADKTPGLERFAHMRLLEDVEDAIIERFGDILGEDDKDRLRTSRKLRNKLLHCDFRVARERLADLGHEPRSGGVWKLDLGTEEVALVSSMKKSEDGGIFGWLLESATSGDLRRAYEEFSRTVGLIRLRRHPTRGGYDGTDGRRNEEAQAA